jgi:hypothetical protein
VALCLGGSFVRGSFIGLTPQSAQGMSMEPPAAQLLSTDSCILSTSSTLYFFLPFSLLAIGLLQFVRSGNEQGEESRPMSFNDAIYVFGRGAPLAPFAAKVQSLCAVDELSTPVSRFFARFTTPPYPPVPRFEQRIKEIRRISSDRFREPTHFSREDKK